MRIAIISGAYEPFMNGVTTSIMNTERVLRARGWDVLMLSPRTFEGNPEAVRTEWKESFPCPGYDIVRLIKPTVRNIQYLFRALDAFRPESLHIVTECPLGWMGKLYAWRRGLRYTTAYHTRFPEIGAQVAHEKFHLPYAWAESVGRWYVKKFHHGSSAVMVSLPTLAKELSGLGFENTRLWSRGIDHGVFRKDGPRIDLGPPPVYMHYGRLSIDKGFPEFCELRLPGTMVAVGEGPPSDIEKWKKQYPWVRFMGRADGEMRGVYLRSASVMIFLSKIDTFGLVTIEANACGTPVAAPDCFPHNDLIVNGVNGWVSSDVRRSAEACANFSTTMRDACVETAQQYTWDHATDQFIANLVPVK